jgi:two-component sensor histidine kinase
MLEAPFCEEDLRQMTPDIALHENAIFKPGLDELLQDEAEHRLGNFLQILVSGLDDQIRSADDPDVRAAIASAAAQIIAFGRLQQALGDTSRRTPADVEDIRRVCNLLEQLALAPRGHRLVFASGGFPEGQPLRPEMAHRLLIVLTELVTNSAKHAFPADGVGEVTVSLTRGANDVVCQVTDNGIGLLVRGAADGSRGMTLAQRIVERAGGRCRWVFSMKGTVASVSLPF